MTAAQFWDWFRNEESRLWETADCGEEAPREIQRALSSYRAGLGVEVSDVDHGIRELIISGEGDQTLFDAVERLVSAAPTLRRWKFTALKPPRGFDFVLKTGTTLLDPQQIVFEPISNEAEPLALGIRVFLPQADLGDDSEESVGRIVETGLGERGRAGIHIEVAPLTTSPEGHIPLLDLPAYLEWFKRKSATH